MVVHKKIIKHLFFTSVLVGILVSIITLLISFGNIEDEILVLAKDEVKHFVQKYETSHSTVGHEIDLSQSNFLDIKIFDKTHKLIYSTSVDHIQGIQKELEQIDHHLITKRDEKLQEIIIHNHIRNRFYLQFKAPLILGEFQGSIEGLYQVSDKNMWTVYSNIAYSLSQLLVTVLITVLLLYPTIVYLNRNYIQQSKDLLQANLEIMSVLGGAIAKRDNETNTHNYRVTLYAIALGEALKLPRKKMMGLIKGAFLHDVGKIGVNDSILLKPGKLSAGEFEEMKYHVEFGIDIISKSRWLDDAKDVVAYHHEKWDGTGYKANISGEQIPLVARIFMICDVFDALTSKRPYKEPINFEASINIIKEKSGNHFDPRVVEEFCKIAKRLYTEVSQIDDEKRLHMILDNKLHYYTI